MWIWSGSTDNVGIAGYSIYRDGVPSRRRSRARRGSPIGLRSRYSVSVETFDAAGNHSPRTTAVVNTTSCADTDARARHTT